MEIAVNLFEKRINVPPTDDLSAHFQAHDAAVAQASLNSAEVFADIQNDSVVSLSLPQLTGTFIGESSSSAREPVLQQPAGDSREQVTAGADDDSEVQVVEPSADVEEEMLSHEAFFGQYRLSAEETHALSFIRDRFPHTFYQVRELYSLTMGRLQLRCLYSFLKSIRGVTVGDLCPERVEEIGLTVQNFDKLGFDIWWVYKELENAKIMCENEQLWRNCEGAKIALDEARAALVKAQDALAAAEEEEETCRKAYERMVDEARNGDKLIDIPLNPADPFLKAIFGA